MGYVYVLTNEGMPDLVKIGHGPPERRAKELSAVSGVPHKFVVAAKWLVSRPREAEAEIHHHLREYRVNTRREFFRIAPDRAKAAIEGLMRSAAWKYAPAERAAPAREKQRTTHKRIVLERDSGTAWDAVRKDQRTLGWD
jgi:hypothetical protein